MITHTRLLLCACLTLVYNTVSAQFSITGKVFDDTLTLPGASVIIYPKGEDSTKTNGTVTDDDGNFKIENVATGTYTFKVLYISYKTYVRTLNITGDVDLGNIKLKEGGNVLKDVVVTGKEIRAQQNGDTSQFNANAYKTNPDATAEDLVTKMPGITSDNSGVKVNGEAVQQVYVDGKPFFGTDPTLALKNLPSEVIDKIQVFDKLSDQAQFTGFDDGNSQKTINIVTKKNKSNGQFGKIYGGYGTDDRYLAGGSMNFFDGDRRISVIELSNNVNQQNFSSQDILGISGGSGQNRGGGGRGSFGGGPGGGGGANNFLVGQQGGITTTHSVGINYSDNWGKKIKVTGSYFFNYTDNINNTQLTRNYFAQNPDSSQQYGERDFAESKNINHRFNLRFEYTIDSFNSLLITPNLSVQANNANSTQFDTTYNAYRTFILGQAYNASASNNNGYSFSNNILYQHKFQKKGRTVSLNLNTSLNDKTGTGNFYSTLNDSTLNYDYTLANHGYTLSSNVTYTEPIGGKGQLMFNYNPSYTKSRADKETYNFDPFTSQYTDFDSSLSNKYNSTYVTQRGGVNYRIGDRKLNVMIGLNAQHSTLSGDQTFPQNFTQPERNFDDLLPSVMLNYRYANGRNLRIMYRTNITAPSVTQLQNVVDISNPLLLKTGNPSLRQDYEHTLIVRYGLTKAAKAHSFFVFLYGNYINNYIGNATYLATEGPLYQNGILIPRGSQLTLPVNLNGYWNDRAFVTYGIPADFIKSNLNFNAGFNYTRTPGLLNDQVNYSSNYAESAGIVLSSNVSENLDFTLAYSGSYNILNNTTQTQANSNYYNHTASFKINWIFLKGVVLNTNVTHTYYSTFTSTAPDESFFLWNAYIGYKFLKNKALEARITAYDILNQNKSISRTITDTYIENSTTDVLKQYFMFSLTYTLRNFKGAMPAGADQKDNNDDTHMHFRGGGSGGQGGSPHGGPNGF